MCYRCSICKEVIPAGTPRKTHVISRVVPKREHVQFGGRLAPIGKVLGTRTEIKREIPVCDDCVRNLNKVKTKVSANGKAPFGRPQIVVDPRYADSL